MGILEKLGKAIIAETVMQRPAQTPKKTGLLGSVLNQIVDESQIRDIHTQITQKTPLPPREASPIIIREVMKEIGIKKAATFAGTVTALLLEDLTQVSLPREPFPPRESKIGNLLKKGAVGTGTTLKTGIELGKTVYTARKAKKTAVKQAIANEEAQAKQAEAVKQQKADQQAQMNSILLFKKQEADLEHDTADARERAAKADLVAAAANQSNVTAIQQALELRKQWDEQERNTNF